MGKIMIAIMAAMLACACDRPIEQQQVTVAVVSVRADPEWGCMGEDYRTLLQTDAGERVELCGVYGQPGDTLTMWRVRYSGDAGTPARWTLHRLKSAEVSP